MTGREEKTPEQREELATWAEEESRQAERMAIGSSTAEHEDSCRLSARKLAAIAELLRGTTQKPDEEPEGWPVQKLCRSGAGHLYIPAPSMRATDAETYYPQRHPAVLSPDAARLLDRFLNEPGGSDHFSTAERRALDRIAASVADYAKGANDGNQ